jgi:hypothetical protein
VSVCLSSEQDAGSRMSRITGVTFAFAGICFVVKVRYNRLKAVTVIPDTCTVLCFCLHGRMHIPADFAPVIIAAVRGLSSTVPAERSVNVRSWKRISPAVGSASVKAGGRQHACSMSRH